MKFESKNIFTIAIALFTISLHAQEKTPEEEEEDRLNGGTITLTTIYEPTISDAFKVSSIPQINDTTAVKKKPVTYRIYSVPVVSTFTPVRGQLNALKPKKREKYFDNYARLGLGNYTNVLAEFAGNFEIDRYTDFGVFMNHRSSQGGIDEVVLEDDFTDTALDISYGKRLRDKNWSVTGGARYRTANWYGTFPFITNALIEPELQNAPLSYINYGAGGRMELFDSMLEKLELRVSGISSGEDATEFRVEIRPELQFNVLETDISMQAELDYLNGSFDTDQVENFQEQYSYLNSGVNPSINLYGDNYKVELGARLNYLQDIENSVGQFNIYPDVNASYIVVEDLLVGFAQVGGGLDLNSLASFTDENLFIAPAVVVAPTDRQIDAQLGVRGMFTSQFGYKLFGGYKAEENRYFYTSGTDSPAVIDNVATPFSTGNVFFTEYGDLVTTTLGGALTYDNGKGFDITLQAASMGYDVDNGESFENVASHLPEFTADFIAHYEINEKWNVGATLYYVGERQAFRKSQDIETLESFADLNLDVTYKINPKLSAFLRGNNLTGGNYQFYSGYPVQDVQVMGGAVYKFDF